MKRLLIGILIGLLLAAPLSWGDVFCQSWGCTLINAKLSSPTTDTLSATSSLTVGGSTPTAITNIRVYSQSLTPAATTAAIQTSVQNFTVTGLANTDKVYVNGPVPTSLCPMVAARAGANTLQLDFTVLTAAICTPAAGTYLIVAIRS